MARRILITGGSGFIGSKSAMLLKRESKNFVYSYTRKPVKDLEDNGLKMNLLHSLDVENHKKELQDVTDLIHAAALVPSQSNTVDNSSEFNAYILDSLTMFRNVVSILPRLKRIVFISSCYIELDDETIGFYGTGKSINEEVVHRFARLRGIDSISLRFPQIYGPGETHGVYINKFAQLAVSGKTIHLDEKANVKRDALYIDDAVSAIVHGLNMSGNQTITISSDMAHSVLNVAETIKRKTGIEITVPKLFAKNVQDQHFHSTYNVGEFRVQYSLDKGLDHTLEFYRKMKERYV